MGFGLSRGGSGNGVEIFVFKYAEGDVLAVTIFGSVKSGAFLL